MRINDQTLKKLSVLKAIRRSEPISRTELPGLTGLSGGTITQLTSDLLKRGLIVEKKEGVKRTGRPRTYLEINAAGGVVVGASIEGVGILTTAFVDLAGNRLFALDVHYGSSATLAELAGRIAEGLLYAIEASPFSHAQISRIGIALPAIIDSLRGIVHFMMTFPTGPVPFARIIQQRVDLPVTIENDAVCMARAEHWFGRAQHLETFTMVHVGLAIGSAKYNNGIPRYGATGLNPEMGHVKTDAGPDARSCYCGAKGCLTSYSSIFGILSESGRLTDAPFPPVESFDARFETFMDQLEKGDRSVGAYLETAARHLGLAIANHMNANDPGNVLILVSNRRFLDLIEGHVGAVIDANVLPGFSSSTNLLFGIANNDWRWKGTAALALEQAYLGGD